MRRVWANFNANHSLAAAFQEVGKVLQSIDEMYSYGRFNEVNQSVSEITRDLQALNHRLKTLRFIRTDADIQWTIHQEGGHVDVDVCAKSIVMAVMPKWYKWM